MSERYTKLFSLPENLYVSGSPVVIAAGALLKDNQTGKVIAQLKIQSIDERRIKAATVCITPLDTAGKPLGNTIRYQYLDLNVARDEFFGQKAAISLPNAATRSFSVKVEEIIYVYNTIWTDNGEQWKSLAAPVLLSSAIKDNELVKQYRMQYGNASKYCPNGEKDLWYCTCGALNRNTESTCHKCNVSLTDLLAFDMEALKADRDARIASEKQKAAEDKAAADAKAKKTKKFAMIVTSIVVLIIIAAVIISNAVSAKQEEAAKLEAYNTAITMLDNGQYTDAIEALTALGDYKDCEELIASAKLEEQYYLALDYIDTGDYSAAEAIFERLGDYKDCKEQLAAIEIPLFKEDIARVNVGGTLTFGTYEQDNNTANGAEPIEWIVLQSDEPDFPYVMAISKYVLDAQPFHSEKGLITWENCSLRTWLNNDFLTSAFTNEELALLSPIHISTPDNPTNGTDCGNDTIDTVFLLCAQEASSWSSIVGDETPTTAYAQSKGLREEASWMFRTIIENEAASGVCVAWYVHNFGSTLTSPDSPAGVRPCIVFYVGNE